MVPMNPTKDNFSMKLRPFYKKIVEGKFKNIKKKIKDNSSKKKKNSTTKFVD